MQEQSLPLNGGAAEKPRCATTTTPTEIRISICGGQKPRLSIGIPRDVFEILGLAAGQKVDLSVLPDGELVIAFAGQDAAHTTFSGDGHGFYWVQMRPTVAPWECRDEKLKALHLPAAVLDRRKAGGIVTITTDALPDVLFRTGKRPAAIVSLDDLRARLAAVNEQIEARERAGQVVRPTVKDGRFALAVVEEIEI